MIEAEKMSNKIWFHGFEFVKLRSIDEFANALKDFGFTSPEKWERRWVIPLKDGSSEILLSLANNPFTGEYSNLTQNDNYRGVLFSFQITGPADRVSPLVEKIKSMALDIKFESSDFLDNLEWRTVEI
jgi:hypothetical protein